MKNRVCSAAVVIAVLAIAVPVRAESPMTPLRPTAPVGAPVGASRSAAPSTAQPWVEPPAASTPKTPSPSTAESVAPNAQSEQPLPRMGLSRDEFRYNARAARGRGWSNDYRARRQELYGGWSGASVPYYRGYGPAPYSNSGY